MEAIYSFWKNDISGHAQESKTCMSAVEIRSFFVQDTRNMTEAASMPERVRSELISRARDTYIVIY